MLRTCTVRSWRKSDAEPLVRYANDRDIWLNLRDRFPHPYDEQAAREWLDWVTRARPETNFAIAVDDEAIGGIGFTLQNDVERVSAEIGYWLGRPFWGRGIATESIQAVTGHAFRHHDLARVFALPFAHNAASIRALEKAGYVHEGTLRHSAIKDGQIVDQLLYACYADTV